MRNIWLYNVHVFTTPSMESDGTESVIIADEGLDSEGSIVGTFSELLPYIDIGTTVTVSYGTVCVVIWLLPPANDIAWSEKTWNIAKTVKCTCFQLFSWCRCWAHCGPSSDNMAVALSFLYTLLQLLFSGGTQRRYANVKLKHHVGLCFTCKTEFTLAPLGLYITTSFIPFIITAEISWAIAPQTNQLERRDPGFNCNLWPLSGFDCILQNHKILSWVYILMH